MSIVPLKYKIQFAGFAKDEVLKISLKTPFRPLSTQNISANQELCVDLEKEQQTIKHEKYVDLIVETQKGSTLKIKLPTLKFIEQVLSHVQKQIPRLEKEMGEIFS